MRYVIGIDAGQTGATAVVADASGVLLGVGHGGSSNHLHEPGGRDRASRSLMDAIQGALRMADLENATIAGACVSITSDSDELRDLCELVIPTESLHFGEDTRIAFYSTTLGKPGVVVVAGTGCAVYGRNEAGDEARSSGWGSLLGDEGSGYWIAIRGLNACCRADDGIAPPTQMLAAALQRCEANDLREIHRRIYSGAMSRKEISALSEVVGRVAAQGDAIARGILRDAGKDLALAVGAVIAKLGLEARPVAVGTAGGVFRSGRLVLRSFRETVSRRAPLASFVTPRVPSVVGATLLALEELGGPPSSDLLARVEATLPLLGVVKI